MNACNKFYLIVTQFLVKRFDECITILRAEVSTIVSNNTAVVQSNKIAAHSHVLRF